MLINICWNNENNLPKGDCCMPMHQCRFGPIVGLFGWPMFNFVSLLMFAPYNFKLKKLKVVKNEKT